MRFLRQTGIILLVSFIGEALNTLLPFPVPASVYGLALMLAALCSGLLKEDQVREASDFFIEIMPVLFIPAGVGLLNSWGALKPVLAPVAAITVITTVLVMVVTGRVTQAVMRKGRAQER